jgi:hypothetical protein
VDLVIQGTGPLCFLVLVMSVANFTTFQGRPLRSSTGL